MIPALTVTDEATAEILLRALVAEWDRHMRQADRTHDGRIFELMIDAGVQAAELGVDHTRYLNDTAVAIVDATVRANQIGN